jgi:pyruvate formate lyase activating enzyme
MVFKGFQKLDLVNYPSHVAATVFTGGCNLRCPYCHNPELAKGTLDENHPEEEILEYLERRKSMLEGLVISGGEPTLHDLVPFIEKVRALGIAIKLDTNGLRPQVLEGLLERGLVDYVAVDIKASPAGYTMLGTFSAEEVSENLGRSLDALRAWGDAWEVRTTYTEKLIPDSEIEALVKLGGKAPHWYIQAFNPAITLDPEWGSLSSPTKEKMEEVAQKMKNLGVNVEIR